MKFSSGKKVGNVVEIDWLMYRSYEFQRDNSPKIEAKEWKRLYYNQEIYEEIYQNERI